MLRALDAHDVRYVIVGGVAARLHGDPTLTGDLDITPDPEAGNLARLAAALGEMNVGLRVPGLDEPLPFEFDAASIARFTSMATRGSFGDLVVVMQPDGIPGGYQQLAANAVADTAYGLTIAIGDLDDLIAARRAAAALTGRSRYDAGAERLAQLPGRRHPPTPGTQADAQAANQTRTACFPHRPAATPTRPSTDPPRAPDKPPRRNPGQER